MRCAAKPCERRWKVCSVAERETVHPEDSHVRLFFALWPDADTSARIARIADALPVTSDARPVARENYHVTLAFIGEVPQSELAVLQQIGSDQHAAGCTIKLDTCEYWPDSQVVVAVARQAPAALLELWTRLHAELALRNEVLHLRPVHPPPPLRVHVTLARKVAQAPVLQAMSPFSWSARSFSLVRSDAGRAHSVYTVVDTWQLLDESPKQSKSL
jgi:2'-5' RNA ligase